MPLPPWPVAGGLTPSLPPARGCLTNRGRIRSDATRAAISRSRIGVPLSAKHREALRAGHRRWWATATDEQKAARPYPRGPWNRSDTSIERAVAAVLDELGQPYEAQKRIASWTADFYLPRLSLVLECDGDYWHSRPEIVASDRRKDEGLRARGFIVGRLTETAINQDARGCVVALLGGISALSATGSGS